MLHPFITAELVRQRRADLKSYAGLRRLARTTRREPDTTIPISRLRSTARTVHRSARSRLARVVHGSVASHGR
jgi:hypothetical protein